MAIYIVGYGTLLYTESVGDTIGANASRKEYIPVIFHGFKRLFNLLPSHYKPSYKISRMPVEKAAANIIQHQGASVNGLAFEVSDDELDALDRREKHYKRIETTLYNFDSHKPIGKGFVYAAEETKATVTNDPSFLPDWEDISWARTGAYSYGAEFGLMYDNTTFLADGETLVVSRYVNWLDQLIIKKRHEE